jgi:hypothetical protein
MAKQHSPLQQLQEARQIALDNDLLLIEKVFGLGKADYILYRKHPCGNIRLGKRSSPEGIRRFVGAIAYPKAVPAKRRAC